MSKLKVLLVDDEPDLLKLMGERIKLWDYILITAPNGKRALEILRAQRPDIIILDYMMPDIDGIATLKEIRKVSKKIPVIMFTAHPNEKNIKGAQALGINAFVPKLSLYSDAQHTLKTAKKLHMKYIT